MGSISQAKALGGVGSVLMVISAVPYLGGIVGIVGLILVLIALKGLADALKDDAIFRDGLYAVVLEIVGLGIAAFFVFTAFFTLNFFAIFGTLIMAVLIAWLALLGGGLFWRRAYSRLGRKVNVPMFATVGLLYLLGGALVIVLVGLVVLFVAYILQAVAFFSMPEEVPGLGGEAPPQPQPTQ
jgi:uncharacterized membrane protein